MMADKCLAEGVERAGADVPENDADGRQRQLGQPVLAMAVNPYRFAAVSSINHGDVRLGLRSGHATSGIGHTSGGKGAIRSTERSVGTESVRQCRSRRERE